MKLSAIQTALDQLGTAPVRSLGQNFLHDQNLAAWIVEQLSAESSDAWVEIGPGLGALTEFAARRSAHGLLIEKDGRLATFLRERFPTLEIVHGDAAEYDVRELFVRGPVKVLGNLPYYVSSQILFRFTAEPSPVTTLVFTLQRELAERLAAPPRTGEYGALTLLIARRWRVKYLRTLPPTVFLPAPKVESAVVLLTRREPALTLACDGERFNALVKRGFSQRRKQLRKMLEVDLEQWNALGGTLGIAATARAEELSLDQWIRLTNLLSPVDGHAAPDLQAQDVHGEMFDVVDEEDRVTGTATRHEVHGHNLRHRAAHIFVFNRKGELFLQKRSPWKDRHPQLWDSSAAGHVDAGGTYHQTAQRELLEELGVNAEVELIASIAACENTGWEFVHLFRALHDGPFVLHPAEIETGGFFTPGQVVRWTTERPDDFAPGFLACWRCYEDWRLARE